MILKVPYSLSKIINKVKAPFQQGLNTYDLLTAIVVAISLSMFPLIGTTTMLIVAMGLWLKLNLPVMIIMGYISSPLQLVFLLKFIKIGENLLSVKHNLLTITQIKDAFKISYMDTFRSLFFEILCGITGWIITAIPATIIILIIIHMVFKKRLYKIYLIKILG